LKKKKKTFYGAIAVFSIYIRVSVGNPSALGFHSLSQKIFVKSLYTSSCFLTCELLIGPCIRCLKKSSKVQNFSKFHLEKKLTMSSSSSSTTNAKDIELREMKEDNNEEEDEDEDRFIHTRNSSWNHVRFDRLVYTRIYQVTNVPHTGANSKTHCEGESYVEGAFNCTTSDRYMPN
jgi:hypothetical protein